ncbi:N-acetylmuramate alpha-1-phosphate uridylyltransferase MurU [Colwellia hornerae]|uniref:Nucleotidyltransferase family protein n=1 Tax=Colwellia hornerae TaxID=89402 RepID=A0A5C6QBF9_9GAMM|nr:nucleotidyltransferase family protein [Colwellia hornerae]TWX53020.1 nucleotidyltransferase family protein [Colwellia hornerae]TWX59283.1 nucleotidyltransferase family protein [Colwellia hornerae]TWX66169.1 nucleotidyltransferase family protein [Colwellia hornerae]
MKAMILAAGRGERMRPLTDHCPKPLLKVAGIPLIEHHINKLAQCGITDIIINYAWLGEMIVDYLGDGKKFGVNISYSAENNGALETAGGIIQALPLLSKNNDNEPFMLINGDIFTDFSFADMPILAKDQLAHICLVNNPDHNIKGDFIFDNNQLTNIENQSQSTLKNTYTFSGLSLFRTDFFKGENAAQISKLGPMLKKAVGDSKVSASILDGTWTDVGTPERLAYLNR